jgi:hypothetical protein
LPWRTQKLLTDADGNFIPQVWDPSQNKFIPYEAKVRLSGTIPVIYISRLEDRPSATEVEIGQFVILTDEELSTWVSNGVNWVEVL